MEQTQTRERAKAGKARGERSPTLRIRKREEAGASGARIRGAVRDGATTARNARRSRKRGENDAGGAAQLGRSG